MRGRIALPLLVLAAAVLPGDLPARSFEVPRLTGPVVDRGGMIGRSIETQISQALRHLKGQGGTEIAVLTVPDLGGLPIEQASIEVVEDWQLGTGKEDNGVLLMVARKERRIRIEVGQGLEGALTDIESNRIIEDAMVPMFRAGHVGEGILIGVYKIARKTNPEIDLRGFLEGTAARTVSRGEGRSGGFNWSKLLIVLVFMVFSMARFGIFGPLMMGGLGGYGRRGGFGGGGFGGGGFGGGGGGFSGGGASGGW